MSDWGGKRKGAGRPKKDQRVFRRLQVTVEAATLAAITKQSFNLGISRGEVIDQKFTCENNTKTQ